MLNFTVGPVSTNTIVSSVGAEQVPYFRTQEFSNVMLENEKYMLKFSKAPKGSRAVFLTTSGTGAMEATVLNCFTSKDSLLIVNGGSFGQRFCDLCDIYEIPYTQIELMPGHTLTKEDLSQYNGRNFTGMLVNIHETSTGVHYDLGMISQFCKSNHMFLVVDAISSFLADKLDMASSEVDVMITGSQKALACPPGVSIVVLSQRAVQLVQSHSVHSLYLDLKLALLNGERGQTPFTPAVGILRQLNARFHQIDLEGGVDSETSKIAALATYFRTQISLRNLPFENFSNSPSNAVTALHPTGNVSAYSIFLEMKDNYQIWICPNGGALKDSVFRVGHIGDLDKADYDTLLDSFDDMKNKGLLGN